MTPIFALGRILLLLRTFGLETMVLYPEGWFRL